MFAKKSPSPSVVSTRSAKHDAVVSKLLSRVVAAVQMKIKAEVPPEAVDEATSVIRGKVAGGTMSDADVKALTATIAAKYGKAGGGGQAAAPAPTEKPPSAPRTPPVEADAPPPAATATPSIAGSSVPRGKLTKELLSNTSRRQRYMLADAEYIEMAEEDRRAAAVGRVTDKLNVHQARMNQRAKFDEQIAEHNAEAERDRQHRAWLQSEMDRTVAENKRLTREERQAAFDKAMREKNFRELQQRQMMEDRERQRTEEHNESVRHMMMIRSEIERQRDEELKEKLRKKSEWKAVLEENNERLAEKARQKEAERAENRRYQKEYEDNLDRQDRLRAEERAAKDARMAYFGKLATQASAGAVKKEMDLGNKIEMEYREQLRRSLEDEQNRKMTLKRKLEETNRTRDRQCAEKREAAEEERRQSRLLAEAMREEAAQAAYQEKCRKLAQRNEAQRMREFLNTQLQMMHYKEARPLETSIMRPPSAAKHMYSPVRQLAERTPSPLADLPPA